MTMRAALVTLTVAAATLAAVPADNHHSAQAEDSPWLNATILFQTDVKGKIEPCG